LFEGSAPFRTGARFQETAHVSRAPFEPGALPSNPARSLRTTVGAESDTIDQRGEITRNPSDGKIVSRQPNPGDDNAWTMRRAGNQEVCSLAFSRLLAS
jgi:hypothetical protein